MTATVSLVLAVCATWTLGLAQKEALTWTCEFPLEQSTNLSWVNGSWYNSAVVGGRSFYDTDYNCKKLDIKIQTQTNMVFQYHLKSKIEVNDVFNVFISNQLYWTRGNSPMRMTDLLKDGSVLAISECSFEERIILYTRNYTVDNWKVFDKLRKHFNTLWLTNCSWSPPCTRPVNGGPTINTFVPFGLLVTTVLLRVL